MFKELPEGQTYSCTHTIDGSICGKCLGVKGFVEQRHSEKPDGMKPTLIETLKNCTMIALILITFIGVPVAIVGMAIHYLNKSTSVTYTYQDTLRFVGNIQVGKDCQLIIAASKEEASRLADKIGCPVAY